MEKSKQIMDPWEMMYEPFKGIYTKDEIDEMTLAEISELHDQHLKEENKNELNTKITMGNTNYNGYHNYETWRVMLEILGDIEWDNDEEVTADILKEIVDDIVFSNSVEKDCLAADYARSFLSNVNYYELAETINEDRVAD